MVSYFKYLKYAKNKILQILKKKKMKGPDVKGCLTGSRVEGSQGGCRGVR